MALFLILLAACIVGGFLVTALIWVLFWIVGVFEAPEGVKNLLAIRPTVQRYQNVFDVGWESHATTRWAVGFERIEGPMFGPVCDVNSASQPVLRTETSPDRNNTAPSHAFAAH